MPGIEDFRNGFYEFLDQFGHMGERTGVFDTVPWRETPDLIMDLIVDFKKPEGDGVHKVRLQGFGAKGDARSDAENLLSSRPAVPFTPGDVQFSVYLHANAVPGYYVAIGARLTARGLLDTREDIYYIYDKEIRAFAAGDNTGADFKDLVSQRKEDMAHCENAILPQIIYGNEPPPIVARSDKKLTGTPT